MDVKLHVDWDDVVHWYYAMAGQLTVCGQQVFRRGRHAGPEPQWPTCMRCCAIAARDHAPNL
jgi:hypothetical protein